jgi:hypothetical protein
MTNDSLLADYQGLAGRSRPDCLRFVLPSAQAGFLEAVDKEDGRGFGPIRF